MLSFSAILPNLIGLTISSSKLRLRLMEILGNGAYGVVYLAHDLSTPREHPSYYAVKVLLRHPEGSRMASFLQQEVDYLKSLAGHPHIVKLHEVIEEEYYVYLVMDYYPGGDLFGAIVDNESFSQNDEHIRKTFLQLLDAVQYCHANGIYHRDIKPENIMCSEDGDEFYLGDFGLASGSDTSKACGCGSSFYMSPGKPQMTLRCVSGLSYPLTECIDHHKHKKAYAAAHADVWALGIVLINMITRNCPWKEASEEDLGFQTYLREGPLYFGRILSTSTRCSELLAGILDFDVSKRLNIDQIRHVIKDMDTFHDPSTECQPTAIQSHSTNTSVIQTWGSPTRRAFFCPGNDPDLEVEAIPSPYALRTSGDLASDMSTLVDGLRDCEAVARDDSTPVSWRSDSQDSSNSNSDSDGPITPETIACDPECAVLEFSLEQTCAPSGGEVTKQQSRTRKIVPGVQRVVDAIHRMKIRA